jgi:hypothetical protein
MNRKELIDKIRKRARQDEKNRHDRRFLETMGFLVGKGKEQGEDFEGIPYAKLKVWAELPLRDRRVKPASEKKVSKTFRMTPRAIERLHEIAQKLGRSELKVGEDRCAYSFLITTS